MKVNLDNFAISTELKNNGMPLEVRDPDGTLRGTLVVTKTKLVWCRGKIQEKNGAAVSWNDFISWMES